MRLKSGPELTPDNRLYFCTALTVAFANRRVSLLLLDPSLSGVSKRTRSLVVVVCDMLDFNR